MTEAVLETLDFCRNPQAYEKGFKIPNICTSDAIRCKLAVKSIKKARQIRIRIKFDWDDEEIKKVSGTITVMLYSGIFAGWTDYVTYVNVEKRGQCIEKVVESPMFNVSESMYACSLTIHRSPRNRVLYDKMFAPSEKTDAVLVIGEKKLHVNKAFLSYHSNYFCTLFAKHVDKKNGIPIEGVTYAEFGLLMSTIYPDMVPVTEKTADLLLSLGQRFEMPAVMHHVENLFIDYGTAFPDKQLILLADKYNLQKLLEETIDITVLRWQTGSTTDGSLDQFLNDPVVCSQLSDSAKAKIFDCLARNGPTYSHDYVTTPFRDEEADRLLFFMISTALCAFVLFIILLIGHSLM